MPKLIFATLMVLIYSQLFAQSKASNEIVAEGAAKMKVKPDVATFMLTVSKIDTVEKNVLRNLNKAVDELVRSLSSLGFKSDNIKIASYDLSSSMDRFRNKEYTATNELIINFKIDNKLIGDFYSEIEEAGTEDVDVSFETSLSDSLEKVSRSKLVQQAVADARTNATNIAQALNLRIKKVKQVQKYGLITDIPQIEMVKLSPVMIRRDSQVKENTAFARFQVQEVELEEKITVIYEIEN
jgi:uncharacterized protein